MANKKLYVDSETTGVDPKTCGMIQFSAVAIIDGKREGELNLKLAPFEKDVITKEALECNHITLQDLQSLDRLSPKAGHAAIMQFLAQYVDKYDKLDKFLFFGYKATFDSDFLREFFSKNGDNYYGSWFFVPPLDVMILAGYLLQKERHKLPNFQLRTVFEYLCPDKAEHFNESYKMALQIDPTTLDPWHDSMFDIDRTLDIEAALRARVMRGG